MYISNVSIQNFRNFKNFEVALQPYSVIVGANKVGKSNLLYAIRLAIDPNLSYSQRLLTDHDFYKERLEGVQIVINVTIQLTTDEALRISNFAPCSSENCIEFNYQFPQGESFVLTCSDGSRSKETPVGTLQKLFSFDILDGLRDVVHLLGSQSRSPLRQLIDKLSPGVKAWGLPKIAEAIKEAVKPVIEQQELKTLLSDLNDLGKAMVGSNFNVDTSLDVSSASDEDVIRLIELLVDKGRPVSRASLGTQNVLYMALLLQTIYGRLPNEVGKQPLILLAVEEPEAHIHPHVQRSMFRYLTTQVPTDSNTSNKHKLNGLLVTTHSPHITSVSPLKSIVLLQNTADGTKAHKVAKDIDAADIAKLERFLDVTRSELLFAKGIIFVEGDAERYMIPAFSKVLDINLDKHGISVVPINGTHFELYVRLVCEKGLNIPFVVLTDGDPDSNGNSAGRKRCVGLYNYFVDKRQAIDSELEAAGLFCGAITLELDLIETCSSQMIDAYCELVGKKSTQLRFRAAIHKINEVEEQTNNNEHHNIVMRAISKRSKGYFAQVLALRVEEAPKQSPPLCPPHIQRCIKKIVELVESRVSTNNAV